MEEKDPIENKFRATFSDYEQEPPDRVWENLRMELHPVPEPVSIWIRIGKFFLFTGSHHVFYLGIGGVVVSMFLTVIFFGLKGHHTIRGHAYAGVIRLHSGSAGLFQVVDQAMPWDSVKHYRSAIIDHYGHFQFPRVKTGKYLLRIAPDGNSEMAKKFLPSWFDQHERSDSCNLIVIKGEDVNVDVQLIKRSEMAK